MAETTAYSAMLTDRLLPALVSGSTDIQWSLSNPTVLGVEENVMISEVS